MTQLDVAMAARAFVDGRAQRSALFRHRHLKEDPIAVVLWQLGAEPFTAAAIAWGDDPEKMHLSVAGEPRNRALAFEALLTFARWFNARFEAPANLVDLSNLEQLAEAPQVIVANRATVEMMGRLGRRLAYLPLDGPLPIDYALVQLGRHLQLLHRHYTYPGQQLVVAMTDLLNMHWATPQSSEERQSLAALDAYIQPREGLHGYEAACEAERVVIGPLPGEQEDSRLEDLLEAFNRKRGKETTASVVGPLLRPIEKHYRPLAERTWRLVWRCRHREAALTEADSVRRRWEEDCRAYTDHMRWNQRSGRRRTRQTPRQAAMLLRRLEDAKACLLAEEACDDPVRMIPYLLDNKAVQGLVRSIDLSYKEMVVTRRMRRPLLVLESSEDCLMPEGKQLWWTGHPTGKSWIVQGIQNRSGGRALITLKLTTSTLTHLPSLNSVACFSIHQKTQPFRLNLPEETPWTHSPSVAESVPTSLEEE